MIQTALTRRAFSSLLQELESIVQLRPLSPEALQQRVEHLNGSTSDQVAKLLEGLRVGAYDNPSGWVHALRHLYASDQIIYGGAPAVADAISRRDWMRPRRVNYTIAFLLGLPFLLLFLTVSGFVIKSCFLFLSLSFLLLGASLLLTALIPAVAEVHAKRLAVAIAVLTSALYYLAAGSSLPFLAFAWLMLLYGLLGLGATLQRLFIDLLALDLLATQFRQHEPVDIGQPLVYVVAQPGWGSYFAQRLVGKVAHALLRYQFRPSGAEAVPSVTKEVDDSWSGRRIARFARSGRLLAYFLVSDATRRRSDEFRDWLIRRSFAVVIVRLPEEFDVALKSELAEQFRRQVNLALRLTPGPVVDFRMTPPVRSAEGDPLQDGISAAADIHHSFRSDLSRGVNMGDLIAPLVQRLSSSTIPLFRADSRLTPQWRRLAERMCETALPPVADIYLRLRLAQSDVERFLVLLEAIELLAKLSVVCLITYSWKIGESKRQKELDKPLLTLGNWQRALRASIEGARIEGTARLVGDFWSGPVLPTQATLAEMAVGAGVLIDKPYSDQREWFDWFVDLRNATRGHGVVDERQARLLWEGLYYCFFDMMSGLAPLVLSGRMKWRGTSGQGYPLEGWLRKGRRTQGITDVEGGAAIDCLYLSLPGEEAVRLFPLLISRFDDVLIWDGWVRDRGAFQALSYATGHRSRVAPTAGVEGSLWGLWVAESPGDLQIREVQDQLEPTA